MLSPLVNSALYWEMGAYATAADLAKEARADFADYHSLLTAATANAVKAAKVELFHVRFLWPGGNADLGDTAKDAREARARQGRGRRADPQPSAHAPTGTRVANSDSSTSSTAC
jgi:hypothetical protein